MKGKSIVQPLLDLTHYGRYRGTFPRKMIDEGEEVILEWKPSRIMMAKGHPILAVLAFPGAFSIPFILMIPLFAFLGVLGWVLHHVIQIGFFIALGVIVVVYGLGVISWFTTSYCVTDRAIYVGKGLFFHRRYRVLWNDVMDIIVKRSPFEKLTRRGTILFKLRKDGSIRRKRIMWRTIRNPFKIREMLMNFLHEGGLISMSEKDLA